MPDVDAPARDWTVPPGEILQEMLDERYMTQVELADLTGYSFKHVNQIIKAHKAITVDCALRLEKALGVSAEFWLTAEMHHRLFEVRR
jgi:HTH-type transcriptional regulator/antitoxin HigA